MLVEKLFVLDKIQPDVSDMAKFVLELWLNYANYKDIMYSCILYFSAQYRNCAVIKL